MMKRIALAALVVVALTGSVAQAASFEGILADGKHGVSHAQYPEKLAGLDASELLANEFDGFGVVVNGVFYRFDPAGNERVANLLRSVDREASNLQVRIEGGLAGGVLRITDIQPAAGGFVRRD